MNRDDFIIEKAELRDKEIRWIATNPAGETLAGTLSQELEPGTILTNDAMKDLADELVGTPLDVDRSDPLFRELTTSK